MKEELDLILGYSTAKLIILWAPSKPDPLYNEAEGAKDTRMTLCGPCHCKFLPRAKGFAHVVGQTINEKDLPLKSIKHLRGKICYKKKNQKLNNKLEEKNTCDTRGKGLISLVNKEETDGE